MSDRRGIILEKNVNLEWIRNFEPKYFPDYIKFVVNPKTNKVNIGMSVHACCLPQMGPADELYGGNIYFCDGHIVYQSTLNVNKGKEHDANNRRIITDKETIDLINSVLLAWVKL